MPKQGRLALGVTFRCGSLTGSPVVTLLSPLRRIWTPFDSYFNLRCLSLASKSLLGRLSSLLPEAGGFLRPRLSAAASRKSLGRTVGKLRELVRAAKAANQSVEGQVLGFRAEAAALGLSEDLDAKSRLKGFEGVNRPRPTSLVPQFLSACGQRQGEMLYRFYSGVAHSALYGIHQYRQYQPTDDGRALRASASLTTRAVANAAVLGITAFLASGEAFAYLYGRDVQQVRPCDSRVLAAF